MSLNSPELTRAKSYFEGNLYASLLAIKSTTDLGKVIDAIENFVEREGRGITTSQLRNIFSKVKSAPNANELQLLRPVLAYTAARQGTQQAKIIIALLDSLVREVNDDEKLKSFKHVMESIVGYHKFHHKS